MKTLLMVFALSFSLSSFAQERQEGDLQLPVTDLEQIERQEEELPPTLDEVEMKQEEKTEQQDRKEKKEIEEKYEAF